MNATFHAPPIPAPALVARTGPDHGDPRDYLLISAHGHPQWVADPFAATAFESMREATRMAMRLPSDLRAFGLPAPR